MTRRYCKQCEKKVRFLINPSKFLPWEIEGAVFHQECIRPFFEGIRSQGSYKRLQSVGALPNNEELDEFLYISNVEGWKVEV